MMWEIDFTQTRNRVALLAVQCFILVISVAYIFYYYTYFIRPDQIARTDFQQTTCLILSKRLLVGGNLTTKYRADFLMTYKVGNVQYNRWVSANGLDTTIASSEQRAITTLASFAIGGQYNCYYNPLNPEVAVLVLRQRWLDTFPLMLPAVVTLLIAYYLFLNLVSFIMSLLNRRTTAK